MTEAGDAAPTVDPGPSAAPTTAPPIADAATLDVAVARSGIPGTTTFRKVAQRLGVATVRDLLFHLPRRYDDLRELRVLGDLLWEPYGTIVSTRVTVADIHVEPSFRRRIQRTVATFEDETGTAKATWFGRRFIERRLHPGARVIVSGKLRRFGRSVTFDNPEFQPDDGSALLHAGRIVPVYRLTSGLTATRLRSVMRAALDRAGAAYPEYLPPDIVADEGLRSIAWSLEQAHYPSAFEARDEALHRLAHDELLALQLGMVARRRQRSGSRAVPIPIPAAAAMALTGSIRASIERKVGRPVELTGDQHVAIEAIRGDLAGDTPMLRLLQGDVGSGKTAVAAFALAGAAGAGFQGALLAPTDLLARQHEATLRDLLRDIDVEVVLLTGSLDAKSSRAAIADIASGRAGVVVGTHALIQERVSFARLGVVVIDEQHRFGVAQRSGLEAKAGGLPPHVLLMTATPIPRTLGQVLYADLDLSDLRTPPEGRTVIRTGIRTPSELDGTWAHVRSEAASGGRTFVVVPLIEDDAADETAVAAESEARRLGDLLAPLRVGMVHGRMKALQRDAEMARFRAGELDVLVGTTVVEVGVDVPEASTMIIEGADRFGLAQLHQLRGRVGRGERPSFCVLVSDSADETAQARLRAIVELRDGFALAEKDFELRREGDVLGLVQSGLPQLRVASLQVEGHRELAVRARARAEALLDERGDLRRGNEALGREVEQGWLASIASGDPGEAGAA